MAARIDDVVPLRRQRRRLEADAANRARIDVDREEAATAAQSGVDDFHEDSCGSGSGRVRSGIIHPERTARA